MLFGHLASSPNQTASKLPTGVLLKDITMLAGPGQRDIELLPSPGLEAVVKNR